MLKIRSATQSDAEAMMHLHRDAVFSKASAFYDLKLMEAWSPGATTETIGKTRKEIAEPNNVVLIAENNGEPIGSAMANPSQNKLQALYVKPNSIGHIGTVLLAEIEKIAFAKGAAFLMLDSSLNAEAFYKANGYIEIGRADYTSANGVIIPAVQMKKLRPNS